MMRRCSHCNGNGHSARSCAARTSGRGGVMLFGVRLTDEKFVKKSASMGNLPSHYYAAAYSPGDYHSDDPDHSSATRRQMGMRKKGIPWTEEEHRQFLSGLQMLGKGDWRGIAKNYVLTRTPSQVASHAQKYFIHQSNIARKKKKHSLFDMDPNAEMDSSMQEVTSVPSLPDGADDKEVILLLSQEANMESPLESLHSLDLSLKPAFEPLPFRLWPPNADSLEDEEAGTSSSKQIPRPVPAAPEKSIKEMLGISQLTLGLTETSAVQIEPLALSLSLPGMP